MMLIAVAWTVLILQLLTLMLMPAVFGAPRSNISFGTWYTSLIEALLVIPLALRVLGYI